MKSYWTWRKVLRMHIHYTVVLSEVNVEISQRKIGLCGSFKCNTVCHWWEKDNAITFLIQTSSSKNKFKGTQA